MTRVSILDRRGEEALGKPVGTYVTLTLDGLARREENAFGRAARAVAAELGELLGFLHPEAPVLVVGLGNRAITPDAVGPKVHEYTLVTRHLVRQVPEHFGDLRPVASLSAGVLGTTGMESGELVRAVSERLRPACVIAVDALASRSLKRVCRTVQLADTGIAPGSGVGNHRAALDRASLGVPVIAVGVPTVVDGATLACASTLTLAKTEPGLHCNLSGAQRVGKEIARLAKEKNISLVVFDRNGYLYHGRVKAVADGAREGGLEF